MNKLLLLVFVMVTGNCCAHDASEDIPYTGLAAYAEATPLSVSVGGRSQIELVIHNGKVPYHVQWSPVGPLDDPNSESPVATLQQRTTFTAVVTDSNQPVDTATAQITIEVIP